MIDPIKLAEEIGDPDCIDTPFMLFEKHRCVVAAALRLAAASGAYREASIELSGRLSMQTRRSKRVGFTGEWYQRPARNIDRALVAYKAALAVDSKEEK